MEKVQTRPVRIILRAMSDHGPLGDPGSVEIEVLNDQRVAPDGAFLWVRKLDLVNRYPDGARSRPYAYFIVERVLLDAVCVVLFKRVAGEVLVLLRSQLRPPLWFRKEYDVPLPAEGTGAVQWEVPAGLIEQGERGEAGIFGRAQSETLEEVGLRLPIARFVTLGHATSLSPGLIAEKLHFVCAEVHDSDPMQEALGDGHAVEERSVSRFVPFAEALRALASGLLHDVKTEVALARLRDLLSLR